MIGRGIAALAALAACQPPSASSPRGLAPPARQLALADLVGGWRSLFHADAVDTSRIEEERWRLRPDPQAPAQLVGHYARTVEVRALDGVPFRCNQRPWYRQRALFDVVATLDPGGRGFWIRETAYTTEPSPCDHGFRHTGDYTARLAGNRLVLRWHNASASGTQTLWQVDDRIAPLSPAPWPDRFEPTGAWRWDATSYDADGNLRDEHEWWEITRRSATHLDATYRRRVTVRSPDGSPIACANAPRWSFDDAYVLEGEKEEEHWHLYERGVGPGDHPCLRATPRRSLDEATAEQIGDFFVLEWRGKRRQVLYRPDDRS